jgi:ferredoxin
MSRVLKVNPEEHARRAVASCPTLALRLENAERPRRR